MPVERLSHPSDGTSKKLCALNDFEFRVWSQYKLAANDFGVMAYSPAPLIAENRSLEQRGVSKVRKALDRIVGLGLLLVFEHQGDPFVCSPRWGDFQQVRYPRKSHLPLPTGTALIACSASTRTLFLRKGSANVTEESPEDFSSVSEPPVRGRARTAHTNTNANANADAVAQGESERGLGRRSTLMPPPPKNAIFAGKFVVPDFLDAEFERKSHRSYEERQAWYRQLDEEWRNRPIGEDDLKFLRARFTEWVGVTATTPTKAQDRAARRAASTALVLASYANETEPTS